MRVWQGTLVHAKPEVPLEILPEHVIGVDSGKIVFVGPVDGLEGFRDRYGFEASAIEKLDERSFLMPGLVDTHIHAPQYVNCGLGQDLPLLQWLEKYTFPMEARYADVEFARDAYSKVVRRTLRNGTTTACYFATIHLEPTLQLCDIIGTLGQRAYVGKVNMDRNSPEYYVESTSQSVKDTETFIEAIIGKNNPLLTPVVTPRFAPSCTEHLLSSLGELAAKHQVPIQSHISETLPECAWIKQLSPQCEHYGDVYDRHKLLTDKTVMAHGVYLSDKELDVFKQRGAGISHCPNSNNSLQSGHMDCRRAINAGVKVGLGTDVSGGYSPSMWHSIRQCVSTSNSVGIIKGDKAYQTLAIQEAFQLATLGGSRVLGLDHQIGNFEVGKEFDALLVQADSSDSPFDVFSKDSLEDVLQKFMYLGDDRNIKSVFVAGKNVLADSVFVNGGVVTNGGSPISGLAFS